MRSTFGFARRAGVALAVAAFAVATAAPAKPARPARAKPKAAAPAPAPPVLGVDVIPSAAAARVVEWVTTARDNRSLPFVVVDKPAAALMLFDGRGTLLATAPVLLGIAVGDEATPGIGTKKMAEIGPAERTTPAGRFFARYGRAAGRQRVLWVDYTTSVAIHPIPADASPKDRRRERMLSPEADDNRITFGCINVPRAFYAQQLRTRFGKKGGYVYVLPDEKPLEAVFPGTHLVPAQAVAAR